MKRLLGGRLGEKQKHIQVFWEKVYCVMRNLPNFPKEKPVSLPYSRRLTDLDLLFVSEEGDRGMGPSAASGLKMTLEGQQELQRA